MRSAAILSLAFLLVSSAFADEKDAKAVAEEALKKGAALFDARDVAGLTATYTEDARVFWVGKDNDTGKYKDDIKDGRNEIEQLYRDFFKDSNEKTTSRNTIEFASFINPNILVIHGYFEPDINKDGRYSFVQERVKDGDKWKIRCLRLYIVGND